MSPRRTAARFAALIGAGVLVLAACGSDDGGSSGEGGGRSAEAFCAQLADSATDSTATDEEVLANLQAAADAAPSEIADEMNTLVDVFGELQEMDLAEATDEGMAAFQDLLPRLEASAAELETWAVENCPDLPEDFFR
jgi:hypothetical protein